MYEHDNRIVMTLDAGGTNLVFSAIQSNRQVVEPISIPASHDSLESCLRSIIKGFTEVKKKLATTPAAISFAFPGPADYERGIIGDLPNFPSFRGGVALKAMLEKEFGLSVFINNDGNLFAYGEALCGFLPYINGKLKEAGNPKQYRNLLAVTLGTGFGAGVVIDNVLLTGDNGCGGDTWLARNKRYPNLIAEESVSIRAVVNRYIALSGEKVDKLTPKDVFEIAEGTKAGNKISAIQSFEELGEVLGATIAQALNIVDGIVVIGGGLAGASKYIMPSVVKELRTNLYLNNGTPIPILQSDAYDLTDEKDIASFVKDETSVVKVPFSDETVVYHEAKKVGVAVTQIGTSHAVSLGAYAFALNSLGE